MRRFNPFQLIKMGTPPDGYADEVLLYAKADGNIYKKVGSVETRVDIAANSPQYRSRSNTAAQSVPNATWTAIVGNQEAEPPQGGTITVGSNKFTVPLAGIYTISGAVGWVTNNTGRRAMAIEIGGVNVIIADTPIVAGASHYGSISYTLYLAANSVVSVMILQSSGGALNTDFAYCRQTIARVG